MYGGDSAHGKVAKAIVLSETYIHFGKIVISRHYDNLTALCHYFENIY
jgi:hypothetical protein